MTQLDLGLVIPSGVAWWHRDYWARVFAATREPARAAGPAMRVNLLGAAGRRSSS